jgi:hypothetical protein
MVVLAIVVATIGGRGGGQGCNTLLDLNSACYGPLDRAVVFQKLQRVGTDVALDDGAGMDLEDLSENVDIPIKRSLEFDDLAAEGDVFCCRSIELEDLTDVERLI